MSNTGDSNLPELGGASSESTSNPLLGRDADDSPVVNLQVVSPSSQVRSPLSFQLQPGTTVKELKEMIQHALEVSPSPQSQRLIYRGRMLSRDSESLMEIFGEETLKTREQQTFHLVLRPPVTDDVPNSNSTSIPSSSPQIRTHIQPHVAANSLPALRQQLASAEYPYNLPAMQPSLAGPRRNDRPHVPPHPLHQHEAFLYPPQVQHRMLQRMQAHHEEMADQLAQIAREQYIRQHLGNSNPEGGGQLPPGFQIPTQYPTNAPATAPQGPQHPPNGLANQQFALPIFQNMPAQQGRGYGPQTGPNPNNTTETTMHQGPPSRTQSPALPHGHTPDHTTTITRHGVNSNGDRWQITVNESTTVIPPGTTQQRTPAQAGNADIAANLQHILQTSDRLSAMQARLNNLTQRAGGPPGNASAPQRPASTPPIGRIARPAPTTTNSFPIRSAASSTSASSAPSDSPVVYIMSSPSGPQALLINNSHTFYSPGHSYITHQTVNGTPVEVRSRRDRPHRHRHRHRDANPPVADGAGAVPQAAAGQAQNARQRGQPLRIAVLPHVWLVIRLILFVWFFAYNNNSSWSRIFTIWGIALILFIVNTGVFNEIFGAFWNPIRQHLENLLPLAAPNPPANNARIPEAQAGNAAGTAPAPRHDQPNPEEVARRLLEQRRQQDASWMMTQFRRVEHAVLLFVASIVPGTAERHIEARTIEENRLLEERRLFQERLQAAATASAIIDQTLTRQNQEGEAAGAATNEQPVVVDGNAQGDNAIREPVGVDGGADRENVAVPT